MACPTAWVVQQQHHTCQSKRKDRPLSRLLTRTGDTTAFLRMTKSRKTWGIYLHPDIYDVSDNTSARPAHATVSRQAGVHRRGVDWRMSKSSSWKSHASPLSSEWVSPSSTRVRLVYLANSYPQTISHQARQLTSTWQPARDFYAKSIKYAETDRSGQEDSRPWSSCITTARV
jgi:hypothetical protein